MQKIEIYTSGMHCHSCEVLLERGIQKVPGVKRVQANQRTGRIDVYHEPEYQVDIQKIEDIIRENGYKIGKSEKAPWFNPDTHIYLEFIVGLFFVWFFYRNFSSIQIFDVSGWLGENQTSIFAPLFIGLTAGVSSCMAMIGGLILGVSAKWNEEHLSRSRFHRFLPHIWLNLGRIIGFTVFGAILGSIGSILALSTGMLGLLTIVVALVMFFLGLNLTSSHQELSHVSLTLPKFFGSKVGTSEHASPKISAFITGVLTFFLPCGFTFAMQLAAMQSGGAFSGALILGLFAIGTAPGLIGIGGITAFFKGKGGRMIFRFMGVIVLVLSFCNLNNGLMLTSSFSFHKTPTTPVISNEAKESLPSETIRLNYTSNGLSESTIRVKNGGNYKIIIDVKDTVAGCMNTIFIPELDEHIQNVNAGNIVEFNIHPTEKGEFPIICAMGLPHGVVIVE